MLPPSIIYMGANPISNTLSPGLLAVHQMTCTCCLYKAWCILIMFYNSIAVYSNIHTTVVFDLKPLSNVCMKPSYTTITGIRGITHNLDHPTMSQTRVELRSGHVRTISAKPVHNVQRRTLKLQCEFARWITFLLLTLMRELCTSSLFTAVRRFTMQDHVWWETATRSQAH